MAGTTPEILWNWDSGRRSRRRLSSFPTKQWYLEKRNAICAPTCGRVQPAQSPRNPPLKIWRWILKERQPAVREQFRRRTLDKLRRKLLESGVIHTVTLKQTERRRRKKRNSRLPLSATCLSGRQRRRIGFNWLDFESKHGENK